MSRILMTMNETPSATREDHFGVTYRVDEHDCLDSAASLEDLGHDVFFVNWNDLSGRRFDRMFHDNGKRFVEPVPLESMDLIWVYQMEGFYADLPRFLDMVSVFKDACALVVNDPRTIRHNLGKTYLWELERNGVRVIPTWHVDQSIYQRVAGGEPIVLKPVFGERGNGVILARTPADVDQIGTCADEYIAQDYVAGVRNGEKSLMFLGHRYQHAVIKHPCPGKPDEFRCNESRGGVVAVYEPTATEIACAERVLKVYETFGCPVHYSRIDLVDTAEGPVLMEAELLNPAAFANFSGKGPEFGRKVAAYFDGLLEATQASYRQTQPCDAPALSA